MPIPQDKFIGILKAAAGYRQSFERFAEFLRIEQQTHSIPISAIQYMNGIIQRAEYEIRELELAHKVNIDLGLQVYTPARLARNEKMKLNQRIRRTGSPTLPPRDQISIDSPSSLPNTDKLPANVSQEDMDAIIRKIEGGRNG